VPPIKQGAYLCSVKIQNYEYIVKLIQPFNYDIKNLIKKSTNVPGKKIKRIFFSMMLSVLTKMSLLHTSNISQVRTH
jgi:hypothetical protein